MKDGSGLAALIPPLAGADYYAENQDKVVCIIINGLEDSIVVNSKTYRQKMEPVVLSPIQITNIINYINQSWGNNISIKTLESINQELEKCSQ